MSDTFRPAASPPLVALAGWCVPGAGYLLIGQWVRGITVGVTILLLFLGGLLVAGVRVIEVPGFNSTDGQKVLVDFQAPNGNGRVTVAKDWVLKVTPVSELQKKLWSVPQVMTGPIAIASGWYSMALAEKEAAAVKANVPPASWPPHARLADIGALYCSVAGVLNLMAVIDSAWRANRGTGGAA